MESLPKDYLRSSVVEKIEVDRAGFAGGIDQNELCLITGAVGNLWNEEWPGWQVPHVRNGKRGVDRFSVD